jgi:hypothetical protein
MEVVRSPLPCSLMRLALFLGRRASPRLHGPSSRAQAFDSRPPEYRARRLPGASFSSHKFAVPQCPFAICRLDTRGRMDTKERRQS